VNLICLYETGFDKLKDFPEDFTKSLDANRMAEVSCIMEKQFLLSYMGNISKVDSDEMTPFELNNWFELLKKQKELETSQASQAEKLGR
jgi:hypothetical protein